MSSMSIVGFDLETGAGGDARGQMGAILQVYKPGGRATAAPAPTLTSVSTTVRTP